MSLAKMDMVMVGIVIGMVLVRLSDLLTKWSEIYCLNKQRKLDLLLGESILKMQERLKGASNE
jgi:hypothetical protein